MEIRDCLRTFRLGPVESCGECTDDTHENDDQPSRLCHLAEAGLEHPWYAAVVTYRSRLMKKARALAKYHSFGLEEDETLRERAQSNRQVGTTGFLIQGWFMVDPSVQFLLPHSSMIKSLI